MAKVDLVLKDLRLFYDETHSRMAHAGIQVSCRAQFGVSQTKVRYRNKTQKMSTSIRPVFNQAVPAKAPLMVVVI